MGQFVVSGDELTVSDTISGLVWQRDGWGGQTACRGRVNQNCTWARAKAYCAGLTLGGLSRWRLPAEMELVTIMDFSVASRGEAKIDKRAFPSTPSDWFWTSSPYAGASDSAWAASFYLGNTRNLDVEVDAFARCVR